LPSISGSIEGSVPEKAARWQAGKRSLMADRKMAFRPED
jgi:hypothetical protein